MGSLAGVFLCFHGLWGALLADLVDAGAGNTCCCHNVYDSGTVGECVEDGAVAVVPRLVE